MVLHPHVMHKAQAEIDAVVGRNRLPNADDRDKLPYVRAVMREVGPSPRNARSGSLNKRCCYFLIDYSDYKVEIYRYVSLCGSSLGWLLNMRASQVLSVRTFLHGTFIDKL